jgi:hypothetical protein
METSLIECWLTALRAAVAPQVSRQDLFKIVLHMGLEDPRNEGHVVRQLTANNERAADSYNRAVMKIVGHRRDDLERKATARLKNPDYSGDHDACKALLWCLNHYR